MPTCSHPADPAVFHDASQELLSLYATENRWDDAHVILWKVYDRATPAYRPTVLAMRIHSELERIAPTESVKLLYALRGRRSRGLGGTARPGQRRAGLGQRSNAHEHLPIDSPELLESLKRLASICQTLGWSRAAEAWSRLGGR